MSDVLVSRDELGSTGSRTRANGGSRGAPRVLVVEPDGTSSGVIAESLSRVGFSVETLARGIPAYARLMDGGIDLLILDPDLPDVDGMAILASTSQSVDIKTLVLSRQVSARERVRALAHGADDYMAKPYALSRELGSRAQSIMRSRASTSRVDRTEVGPCVHAGE